VLISQHYSELSGEGLRCLVVNGEIVAAIRRKGRTVRTRFRFERRGKAVEVTAPRPLAELMRRTSEVTGLRLAGIDVLETHDGYRVLEVNAAPGIEQVEMTTGRDLARKIIESVFAQPGEEAAQEDVDFAAEGCDNKMMILPLVFAFAAGSADGTATEKDFKIVSEGTTAKLKAGSEGKLMVQVLALNGFHVSDETPFTLKAQRTRGHQARERTVRAQGPGRSQGQGSAGENHLQGREEGRAHRQRRCRLLSLHRKALPAHDRQNSCENRG
jgi:hypothetical protein